MIIKKNTSRLIIGFLSIISCTQAQNSIISLHRAVQQACENSLEYKIAFNNFQRKMWTYQNYKASRKPLLYMDGTMPQYTRSINKITLPSGEDAFVNQNQAYTALNLGIHQNVGWTGGILTLSTSLNRIDGFGNNTYKRFSVIPASISYHQATIGYNLFKWQKKLEPLKFESSQREFVTRMEMIRSQVVDYYFDVLVAQSKQKLSKQNLFHADTLYLISEQRFKLGTLSKSELMQLRLNILNAQIQSIHDSVNLVLARQQFSRFVGFSDLQNWELKIPDEDINYFEIPIKEALKQAEKNNQKFLHNRIQKLESEQLLAQIKSENKLKFSIETNFGVSNTSPEFISLFKHVENQQNIWVSFSIPILDWGQSKTRKLSAEANLTLIENQSDQENLKFEQEIIVCISKWTQQPSRMTVASESKIISEQNYTLEMQRYLAGHISINDLNIAQLQKDNAINNYILEVKNYWDLYYTIRRFTLYDFEQKRKLGL